MERSARIRRTPLPGVGTQYDVTTEEGRRLALVVHLDGRRFLGLYDADDPDTCRGTVALSGEDAESLARLLAPETLAGLEDFRLNLVTEHIVISPKSPYVGRTLGDTGCRTRTGASVVAVLRRTTVHPSPGPDFRFATGDTLVVVGTREGVDAFAAIVAGG
ncbi:cation:proton antiporter regulatory subunit [Allostreptomyces psammosilenae]|uniref:TrkA domain protein n=1 Tax=Allostreptomyces psammosilenae TaxID=1892865 RepID=A0A852ZPE7_9ACTN|nr:cation:proton antiporter regulatory subunit [Allostreptomyces psammosilenae]NYI04326.1 TrkA domain protein [Allostreptomyces psammosilenae]